MADSNRNCLADVLPLQNGPQDSRYNIFCAEDTLSVLAYTCKNRKSHITLIVFWDFLVKILQMGPMGCSTKVIIILENTRQSKYTHFMSSMGSVRPSSSVSLLVVCSSGSVPLLLESSSDSDSDLQYNHVHRGANQ